MIRTCNDRKIVDIKLTHDRKLHHLGVVPRVDGIEPDKVIYNFSDYELSSIQKEAVSLGLQFSFFPTKIRYNDFFMAVEKLFTQLKECNIFNENHDSKNIIRSSIKDIAFKTFYTFKSRMCPYQKQLLQALSELKKNQNIIVTKPDKGNATVILNKADYVYKMEQILADPINFKKLSSDLYKTIIKYEDRNNTLVDDLFKKSAINEAQKRNMKSCGA